MPQKPLSAEVRAKIEELIRQGKSQRETSKQTGVSCGTVSNVRAAMGAAFTGCKPAGEKHEQTADSWSISIPKTRICTLEQLIEHCEIDLEEWEVERFICNKWEMGYKDGDDRGQVMPLFQVKAYLKRRKDIAAVKQEIGELKALAKSTARRPVPIARTAPPSGNMLELNMPDLHFGKLAWGVETGGPNYDTKIAERIYREALAALLGRLPDYAYDEIVFVVGNDLLQSDTPENQTTKGTAVSCDGRYHKTFKVVRTLKIETIELLRTKARRVKVVIVPGNHDSLSMWHLGDSLECYFTNYEDVEIDNLPRGRKYHQFGRVMLMFAHGDKGKLAEFPGYMAIEEPQMWAATKFREAHCGHKHKKQESKLPQIDEKLGVRVRILSALCPPDDWHAENGFIGSQQSAEAFVWNKDEGQIASAIYNARF